MSEINHPILEKKQIVKATAISIIVAAVILVIAVLPAEYGVDPIGAGKLFGFSRLYIPEEPGEQGGEVAVQQASYPLIKLEKAGSGPSVKRPVEADNSPPATQLAEREDTVTVIVPARKGIEFKMNVLKYGTVKYEWSSESTVYFDFHGEVKQAQETKDVFFESYTIAYSNNMVGTFLSPFEGRHGWYFRNLTDKDVKVNVRLKGQYSL